MVASLNTQRLLSVQAIVSLETTREYVPRQKAFQEELPKKMQCETIDNEGRNSEVRLSGDE
ncbi:hypothetical protein NMG60_11003755 [Bertholletia excelsa]